MKRVHYAWAVCAGCLLMLFVCGGLSVNAFSVTQPYILAYGGFSNTQTSLITTLRAVSYLVCMAVSPWFFRHVGYRAGCALATACSAVSFLVYGCARTLGGFYAGGILAGLGYGLGSMIPATVLLSRWFQARQGLALGICSAATGLAMVVFSPVLTALCETYSLQVCFFAEAAFSLVCAMLVFLLVRESPEKCGLRAYGAEGAWKAVEQTHAQKEEGAALRGGQMAALCLAAVFFGGIASPGPSHLMILYTTAGMEAHAAAMAVSMFGLALMVGKCMYGAACDRFGSERSGWYFGAMLCAGLGLCAMAECRNRAVMFAGTALYGLGVPLGTVGLSVWAKDFGRAEDIGRLVQRFQLCYGIGGLALSTMPGMFADWTGSYAPAYGCFLVGAVFCIAAAQRTYRHRRTRQSRAKG